MPQPENPNEIQKDTNSLPQIEPTAIEQLDQDKDLSKQVLKISPEKLSEIKARYPNVSTTVDNVLDGKTVTKVCYDICHLHNPPLPEPSYALLILSFLAQDGGTSKGCSGNLAVTLDEGKTYYTLSQIRGIFAKHGHKNGLKKYAKSQYRNILSICEGYQRPGHLYAKIRRLFPEAPISARERCALSDFQAYNEEIDARLRKYILESFKTRSSFTKKGKRK